MSRLRLYSLLSALCLGVMASSPVSAWDKEWVHPINKLLQYFMPGPPGGDSYLTRCVVQTALEKWPAGDQAILKVFYNGGQAQLPSFCDWNNRDHSWVQVVTYDGSGPVEGDKVRTTGNGTDTYSVGRRGQPILGAHFSAIADNGLVRTWSVSVF